MVSSVQSRPDVRSIFFKEIYGILSYEHGQGRSVDELASAMLAGGIRILQYREKYRSRRIRHAECLRLREMTRRARALFIVNDDVDIAVMCDADGVHIGQDDLPVNDVRSLIKKHQIIGLSTHSPQQAHDAMMQKVDYIGVGPIFATQTKRDVCAPVGLEYLDYVIACVDLPCVAIGGIKAHNIHEVIDHGARCVALVTDITSADHIEEKVRSLKKSFIEKRCDIKN